MQFDFDFTYILRGMNKYILCCDWGTTSFRLRLVERGNYRVIAELLSSTGVAATFKEWKNQESFSRFDFYANKLKESIKKLESSHEKPLKDIPVIVSGMASSSLGMEEIPYAVLPFNIDGAQASVKIFKDFNGHSAPLVLVSGLKSHNDVMRGEEAQLIGLLKLNEVILKAEEEFMFVFPGTHSKHILVKNNLVSNFKTFMTGEIFNILTEHSILKDSVNIQTSTGLDDSDNSNAFKQGIIASGDSSLLHSLFTVRTMQLFETFTKEQNAFYLSGLLIGTELRALQNEEHHHIVICSGKHLFHHYKIAIETLKFSINTSFIQPELIEKATIAGQVQLFNALQNNTHD